MKKPSVENCLPTTEDKHRSPRKRRQQPEYLVLVAIIRVVILFIVSHLFSSMLPQGLVACHPMISSRLESKTTLKVKHSGMEIKNNAFSQHCSHLHFCGKAHNTWSLFGFNLSTSVLESRSGRRPFSKAKQFGTFWSSTVVVIPKYQWFMVGHKNMELYLVWLDWKWGAVNLK